MKKILSILLAVTMLCSVMSTGVFAADTEDYTGKTVILYTGNLRGNVDVYPRIAAAKAAYAAKGADVVLVDAGNYLQGSAAANTDRGLSVYNLMDAAGYDVAAMGLAEFSYADATTGYPYHGNFTRYYTQKMLQQGTEAVEYNQDRAGEVKASLPAKEAAKFRTVATNVTANMETYSFERSVVIETEGGLKLAFYGLTDPSVRDNVQDGFIESISTDAVMGQADAVNIFLSTLTYSDDESWLDQKTDLVIDATGNGAVVGAYVIENETKEITHEEADLSGVHEAVAELAKYVKENAAKVAGTSEVILNGADSVNWSAESNLGDLTADALRWYAENYIDGLDPELPLVAIQNGGNCDNFLYTGDITETDLLNALPFSPMGIGVVYLTGAQLLEAIEAGTSPSERYGEALCPGFAQVSGLTYTVDRAEDYDGGEAFGNFYKADSVNRVTITSVNGADFDPEATYALAGDNYIMNGSDTYYVLSEAREAGATYINNGNGVKTRDVVAMYIQNVLGGTIGEAYAEPQGRIFVIKETAAAAFADVAPDDWYFDAVCWAVDNAIAEGTSDTAFSPANPSPRSEIVNYLYRLAGSPEINMENPFEDVAESSDYYSAVLWAYHSGITTGVDETHFSPDSPVSRAQAMTFLYRCAKAEPVETENPFEDVEDESIYAPAILWAVQNEITRGTDAAHFSPNLDCSRGHIVTFLYRYANI